MGYVFVTGFCFACGGLIPAMHPHKVPSYRDSNGVRQPICRSCIEIANPKRKKNGLPPIEIDPEAYQGCPEEEL